MLTYHRLAPSYLSLPSVGFLRSGRPLQYAALAGAIVVLRVLFRISVLDHWDSIQYALALSNFDISTHTPHPPGSVLYVLLGRVLNGALGSPSASFFTISVAASLVAIGGVFVLANRLFGRWTAWVAALVFATQPAFWFYGAAGNSWTALAALSAIAGLSCLRVLDRRPYAVVISACVLGLASGFRLDVTVFMAPVWLWCLWRARVAPLTVLVAMGLVAACVAVWLIPVTVMTPGGFQTWLRAYTEMFAPAPMDAGKRVHVLIKNGAILGGYCLAIFGPLVAAGVVWRGRTVWSTLRRRAGVLVFLLGWAAPSLIFLWLFDTTEGGHNLLFTAALVPLAAAALARSPAARSAQVAVVAGVIAFQGAVFLFAPTLRAGTVTDLANAALFDYTSAHLRQHESALRDVTALIQRADPETSVIATLFPESSFRFAMYYLPEFTVLRVRQPDHNIRVVSHRRLIKNRRPRCINPRIKSILWITDSSARPDVISPQAQMVGQAQAGSSVWTVYSVDAASEAEPLPGVVRCSSMQLDQVLAD